MSTYDLSVAGRSNTDCDINNHDAAQSDDYKMRLTSAAYDRIFMLQKKFCEKIPLLRMEVVGGGCAGFSISFKLEFILNRFHGSFEGGGKNKFNNAMIGDKPVDNSNFDSDLDMKLRDDFALNSFSVIGKVIDKNELIFQYEERALIITDSCSICYINNVVLDYQRQLQGSRFLIAENPNASSSCGCKESFGV